MKNSRDLNDLLPAVKRMAEAHAAKCKAVGIDLLFTSTERDNESQRNLYSQGRVYSNAGTWIVVDKKKIVTNAPEGYSWHNWKVAYDVVPLRFGKPVWSTSGEDGKLWNRIGEIGESCGLEWAGRWKSFREYAHFQYTAGYSIADFISKKVDLSKFE